jgi:hypothetical protein
MFENEELVGLGRTPIKQFSLQISDFSPKKNWQTEWDLRWDLSSSNSSMKLSAARNSQCFPNPCPKGLFVLYSPNFYPASQWSSLICTYLVDIKQYLAWFWNLNLQYPVLTKSQIMFNLYSYFNHMLENINHALKCINHIAMQWFGVYLLLRFKIVNILGLDISMRFK